MHQDGHPPGVCRDYHGSLPLAAGIFSRQIAAIKGRAGSRPSEPGGAPAAGAAGKPGTRWFCVSWWCRSAKDTLLLHGQNPEANVEAEAAKFPFLPWVSKDAIARITTSVGDATQLAHEGVFTEITEGNSLMARSYQVDSQNTRGSRYVATVDLSHRGREQPKAVRSLSRCTCPG